MKIFQVVFILTMILLLSCAPAVEMTEELSSPEETEIGDGLDDLADLDSLGEDLEETTLDDLSDLELDS
tara:strand:+ start:35144 stop:35350 length:207 start_codon:yes stop_codon:yes gene_type:complete